PSGSVLHESVYGVRNVRPVAANLDGDIVVFAIHLMNGCQRDGFQIGKHFHFKTATGCNERIGKRLDVVRPVNCFMPASAIRQQELCEGNAHASTPTSSMSETDWSAAA